MGLVWCDGEFLEEEDFKVSPVDRGLCHGLSLFETILAVDGRPRLVKAHLDRLRQGLERLGVQSVELAEEGLRNVMVSLLEKNGLVEGSVRIRFTVSFGPGSLDRADDGNLWAWMTAAPANLSDDALRLTVAPWRKDTESVLRGLKTGNYAEHLVAMDMARREGFDEMLFYNTSDELCEAAMANVFLIRGKGLLTPSLDSGCLAGVAREKVIAIARDLSIPCKVRPLGRSEVKKADGIFLTSSVKGPVSVASLSGKSFKSHPFFGAIRERWRKEMAEGSD